MFEIEKIVINVDAARKYLQTYERKLEKMRRKYIKQLCKDIKREAKNGNKMTYTKTLREDFMSFYSCIVKHFTGKFNIVRKHTVKEFFCKFSYACKTFKSLFFQ